MTMIINDGLVDIGLLEADRGWLIATLQEQLGLVGNAEHTARCRRILLWLGAEPGGENGYDRRVRLRATKQMAD